ncbi:MAG: hypothetical protein AAGC44_07150 [Planctomycetota bacterium]
MNQRHLIALATCLPLLPGTPLLAEASWTIDTQPQWRQAQAHAQGLEIGDAVNEGTLTLTQERGIYRSVLKRFDAKRQLVCLQVEQAPLWHNWDPIENLGPVNMQDAPVTLSLGAENYWAFGRYGGKRPAGFQGEPANLEGFDDVELLTSPFPNQFDAPGGLRPKSGGYHAWQSKDMVNWVHHGPVTEGFSRWVTSAEHADGKTYIFYDYPNDQDPHVYVDADLFDGQPGENLGMAFRDPSHGSDAGFIRDRQGKFHVIYEDWSPINASRRSWDSPLAGHAVSDTGVSDYTILAPAVDNRTTDTGENATYRHPHWKQHPDWDTNIAEYDVHAPEQEAYGDWALITVGQQTYLFGDYDPVGGHQMSVCWFTTDNLNKAFKWCGNIGQGHPDPDIMFAEGRFYLFTQQKTDYVSSGPWAATVEARAGADTNNDGRADTWTDWQTLEETYEQREGFSKIVETTPATLDLSGLPPTHGVQFELRLTDGTENQSVPVIDRVRLTFD